MATPIAKRVLYPTVFEVGERDPALVARVLNSAVSGKLNALGSLFIADGAVETRIDDPRIGPQSFFMFQSLTELARKSTFTWWLKERGTRYAIIGHEPPEVSGGGWVEYMVIG